MIGGDPLAELTRTVSTSLDIINNSTRCDLYSATVLRCEAKRKH